MPSAEAAESVVSVVPDYVRNDKVKFDRDEGRAACKPIAITRSLENQWHDTKDQFAAFADAKA